MWSELRADSTVRWLTDEEKERGRIAPGEEDKVAASVAEDGLHESQVGRQALNSGIEA